MKLSLFGYVIVVPVNMEYWRIFKYFKMIGPTYGHTVYSFIHIGKWAIWWAN